MATRSQRRKQTEPPRRPMAAGHVLLVALVALAVGSLLNAKGMLKTANGQNFDGTRRGMALFFARPLYDVSHLLHTDRPRAALQDAIGRHGDDDIGDLAGPSPTTTTTTTVAPGQPTTTTTSAPKQVFTPQHKLRMYIAGDSLAITPGQSLVNGAARSGMIDVVAPVDGRISTGLSRPDVFNWPSHIAEQDKSLAPNAVVLTFGANDDQAVQSPDGVVHSFGTEGWKDEYRRRVGGLMDFIASEDRQVFWIGIPIIRNDGRNARYRLINQIYQEEAAARIGKVYFVDTYKMFEDPNGQYADYLPDSAGQLVKMRAGDGIHFERAGGNRIANAVLQKMNEVYAFHV